MPYYHHDAAGIYVGSTHVDPDPRDPLVAMPPPFGATLLEPPERAEHQAAVFDGQAWAILADWRGTVYWLADGSEHTITQVGIEVPEGALDAPPPASTKVTVVTMRQCQLALLAAGLLDQVDTLIASQARAVRVTWATAGTVERVNPLIASLAQALGLTDAQVDDLFQQAALL